MGTENSNYSHDDQAGGEVQGTVCAASFLDLVVSTGERDGNTSQHKGIQGETGPVRCLTAAGTPATNAL